MSEQERYEKATFFRGLIERKGVAYVHLDPRHPDVDVPGDLKAQPKLVLVFGPKLARPTTDLQIDTNKVVGTLQFKGVPHKCVVPWSRIFGVADQSGSGLQWPESMPRDLEGSQTIKFTSLLN